MFVKAAVFSIVIAALAIDLLRKSFWVVESKTLNRNMRHGTRIIRRRHCNASRVPMLAVTI